MNKILSKALPHVIAVLVFMAISLAYFYPQIQGKRLYQHDIAQWRGSAKEIMDFKEKTGKETLWTNSMFGGMPAYLISANYSGNLMRKVNKAMNFSTTSCQLHFYCYAWFLHPAAGFRIKSLAEFGWCARLGYQTYFFIIIGAGHNSKFRQLAMLHPLIAGLVMACKEGSGAEWQYLAFSLGITWQVGIHKLPTTAHLSCWPCLLRSSKMPKRPKP